jgi:hypothetical protein
MRSSNALLRLGAVLGNKDPRNLRLSNYLGKSKDIAPPPVLIDWDTPVLNRYQMWDNDQIGDCVFAAFYNMLAGASGETGDQFTATNQDVINDYAAVTGYDPNTGANDNGANPEDALRYYSQNGKILAWGEVDQTNLTEIRQAMQIFGGVYTSLNLPLTAQNQVGGVWDVVGFPASLFCGGDKVPGSWGGHQVVARFSDFTKNPGMLHAITWGKSQIMTQAFWLKYVSATYFFITPEWIDTNGQTPSGLDIDGLLKDAGILKM